MENSVYSYLLISAFGTLVLMVILVDLFLIIKNKNQKIAIEKQKREAEIADILSKQELASISAAMESQDTERKRVAQELHDSIGASLSMAKMQYSHLTSELAKSPLGIPSGVHDFAALLDRTVEDVRRISHDLYGNTVSKLGLDSALRELGSAIEKNTGIRVKIELLHIPALSFEVEINMYRMVQELFSNTMKHAEATEIYLQLIYAENSLNLIYEDNGKGFIREIGKGGMGLQSIHDRLKLLGATWALDSAPGQGMTLSASMELNT